MARYTCLFTLGVSLEKLQPAMNETLKACNMDVVYSTIDYIMAREVPGRIAFPKLVTVEVLIDRTTATEAAVRMNLVMKNEELPLQADNHCRQMFEQVTQAVRENETWRLIETVTG
jgi:hypothetical protein